MSTRTLDEIKEEVSIEDVLLECGAIIANPLWTHSEVTFYCPFHLNRNTPAASMNPMKGLWYCHGCDRGGSVIDAALFHLETESIQKARVWLEDTFL